MARVITPEVDTEIRRLADDGKTTNDIARQLKIKYQTVYDHVARNNIQVKPEPRGRYKRNKKEKTPVVMEGYFNLNERENWLV